MSITAAGKTQATIVFGPAAAAAPKLRADMAAVLGVPTPMLAPPQSQVNPGGPNKCYGRLPDSSRSNSPSLTPGTKASHSASVK